MSIRPPTSAEICRVTGASTATRSVMRISDLSVVERVTLTYPSGAKQKAVLKTMHLALRHEPLVHRLVEDFPICAAKIITSENTEGTEALPWMLIEAVEDYSADKNYTTVQMTQALIGVAQLHRYYIEKGLPKNNEGPIPIWGWTFLQSLTEKMPASFQVLNQQHDLNISVEVQHRFLSRLADVSEEVKNYPLTIVHGDFDCGNLVLLSEQRVAALDWGLGHVNLPLVDLAHLVGSLDTVPKLKAGSAYFNALDLPNDFVSDSEQAISQMIQLGDSIHSVFFIWWHSTIVINGWGQPDGYLDTIRERIYSVANC